MLPCKPQNWRVASHGPKSTKQPWSDVFEGVEGGVDAYGLRFASGL